MNFDKTKNIFVEGAAGDQWAIFRNGDERKVVARFKHGAAKAQANDFVKFLIKNYTVEEYFGALDSGLAPLEVLEQKGYISYNMRKGLKQMGYEPTPEGKAQWRADRLAVFEKRKAELKTA